MSKSNFWTEEVTFSWDMVEAINALTAAGLEDYSARVVAYRLFCQHREDKAIWEARKAELEASAVPTPAQTGNFMEIRNGKGVVMSAMDWTGKATFKEDILYEGDKHWVQKPKRE